MNGPTRMSTLRVRRSRCAARADRRPALTATGVRGRCRHTREMRTEAGAQGECANSPSLSLSLSLSPRLSLSPPVSLSPRLSLSLLPLSKAVPLPPLSLHYVPVCVRTLLLRSPIRLRDSGDDCSDASVDPRRCSVPACTHAHTHTHTHTHTHMHTWTHAHTHMHTCRRVKGRGVVGDEVVRSAQHSTAQHGSTDSRQQRSSSATDRKV